MKKVLALLCAGVMAGMMFGCNSNPLSSTTPTITIDNIGAIDAGTFKNVTGKVDASDPITAISYSIVTAAGADVSQDQITVTGPSSPGTKTLEFKDANLISIIVKSAAPAGGYKLKISATAGSATGSGEFDFTVNNAGTPVTETPVTLGAQNAAPPSLLDADNMTAYSSVNTSASTQANIDLIFSFSSAITPNAIAFTSPSVALGSPYDSWTSKPATEFKKVTADYASITTQEAINALWGTTAGDTRITVVQGDVVVVKTSMGAYKLIEVTTVNGNDASATINIKGKH